LRLKLTEKIISFSFEIAVRKQAGSCRKFLKLARLAIKPGALSLKSQNVVYSGDFHNPDMGVACRQQNIRLQVSSKQ